MSNYQTLASISSAFEKRANAPSLALKGSPFEWLLSIPSRSKGAYGEKFVSELFRANGFDVKRPLAGSDHDRVINGHRVEIKLSTKWQKTGHYKFQQIRDQEYDYLLCLGLSPDSAHCWLIPKSAVKVGLEGVQHQHGGKAGTDTLWPFFDSGNPPKWLKQFGGTIDEVLLAFKALGLGPYSGKSLSAKDRVI